MTQRQGMQNGQTGSMNIENLQEMALNVTYNFASMVAMPVEILLRIGHGTRYFSPTNFLLSSMMMLFASAFLTVAGSVGHMIPFVQVRGPAGLFSFGSMTELFFIASFIHGLRIWRLMIHPEREMNSMYEGPPLPFFFLLPNAGFWTIRIIYEPLFVFGLSMVLANLLIIQGPLALYLQVAALMLAMKQFVAWYKFWSLSRNLLDAANVAPIISRIVDNKASDEDMARIHMASLPTNLPPDVRKATIAHLAREFSVSQSDSQQARNPEAGNSGLKFIFLMLIITLFLCFIMGGVTLRRTITRLAHRAVVVEKRIAGRPSALRANSPQERAVAAQADAFRSLSYLSGIWQGGGTSREQGICNLRLEIRPKAENLFAGYSTMTCIPVMPHRTPNALSAILWRSPRSAILEAKPANGSIPFYVLKQYGMAEECRLTALTVTPFGAQIGVEWHNGTCSGAEMVLSRVGQ